MIEQGTLAHRRELSYFVSLNLQDLKGVKQIPSIHFGRNIYALLA